MLVRSLFSKIRTAAFRAARLRHRALLRDVRSETDPEWLSKWKALDAEVEAISKEQFRLESSFTEAHAMQKLGKILPETCAVFFGNGDADPRCRSFSFSEKMPRPLLATEVFPASTATSPSPPAYPTGLELPSSHFWATRPASTT